MILDNLHPSRQTGTAWDSVLDAIVHPYVQDVPGHQVAGLRQLLQESTRQPLGLSTGSVAVFQELCKETIGGCWDAGITPCCCAAIAVLWLALAPERFPLQADTFSCAAGTAGKQKWSLILPSSARVFELTYVTIIGARYPELDTVQNDIIQFGNYLQAEQCTRGGFLPIFWDAPSSYINASIDIGEVVDWITDKFVVANKGDLAVLHNRNKMVNATRNGFQAQEGLVHKLIGYWKGIAFKSWLLIGTLSPYPLWLKSVGANTYFRVVG